MVHAATRSVCSSRTSLRLIPPRTPPMHNTASLLAHSAPHMRIVLTTTGGRKNGATMPLPQLVYFPLCCCCCCCFVSPSFLLSRYTCFLSTGRRQLFFLLAMSLSLSLSPSLRGLLAYLFFLCTDLVWLCWVTVDCLHVCREKKDKHEEQS